MKALLHLAVMTSALTLCAATPPEPKFRQVTIDTNIAIGYAVNVADVNGDKKPDILVVDQKQIVWYENPSWQKHVIAENLTKLDNVCMAVADIDGDGKTEIAVGAGWNPGDTLNSGAVFYLIPPADRTQKWEPVELHHEPTVHRMRWVKNPAGKFDLIVKPLHGKGNKNNEGVGGLVYDYAVPTDPKQPWKTTVISDFMHATHNFLPISWDRDQENELIIAGKEGLWMFDRSGDTWDKKQLSDQAAGEIREGKLPDGKRFLCTIEPMHGVRLALHTQPGPDDKFWPRRVLDDTFLDGHALGTGDFLGTGSDQIALGWRAMNVKGAKVGIKLLTPLDAKAEQWRTTLVDDNTMACEDMAVADLNGDGKLDIVASGRATKNVKIYFNETAK